MTNSALFSLRTIARNQTYDFLSLILLSFYIFFTAVDIITEVNFSFTWNWFIYFGHQD